MTAIADRHLLCGLLALQSGIINQVQLVAAFQAWTLDKSRGLADHLEGRGDLTGARRALLEGLVEVHLEAHSGDLEKSLAAVSAGKSTREGLARIGDPAINETLGNVATALASEDGDIDRTTSYAVGRATNDGPRFRVLRPHARGGLGAVFVALDAELNREVALKQILDHHADDPTSRQRFLVEAEITGGLEHPGIVPVYGLGRYDGGRPYYAMRFIKGDSLKEAIERFHADKSLKTNRGRHSLALRKLLRRFTDACNAIDYAHSRGVLHRDIKPGNIIVGKHGETLVVDWGLAKPLGRVEPGSDSGERLLMPTSASGSAETLAGSALGTPAYMSPEQARGELDRLGPRSDVYSLGATLYCLLTGKPPFEGDDLGEVLRKVERGDFPPPRQLDPSLDRALDAICLKATATKPEDRCASCRELAEDIERWMADEPVSAWREPLSRRVRRWGRRHRTAVTAAVAVVLVALAGTAAVLAVQTRANRELTRANADLAIANYKVTQSNDDLQAANKRERERFDLALEAIKTFHTGVAKDVLLKNDNLRPVRDRLLKGAAEFYERLGDRLSGQADRGSRRALGQAYSEMASLADKIGATEHAIAGHRRSLAVRRELAEMASADAETKAEVGRSLNDLGQLLGQIGRTEEARAAHAEARTLLEGLTQANPALTPFQRDLARSYHDLGLLLSRTGKPNEARALYQKTLAILEPLADANPTITEFQRDLALTHNNVGVVLVAIGKPEEALAAYKDALAIGQRLADANPTVTEFRSELATRHNNIGYMLWHAGKPREALESLEAARLIRQVLADANPAVIGFQNALASTYNDIGVILKQTDKRAEALAAYTASRSIEEVLTVASPTVTEFQIGLATNHNNIGIILKENGAPEEALASFKAARAIEQRLADANPTVTRFQVELANSQLETGDVLRLTGNHAEARASYEAALAIIERLIKSQPALAGELQVYVAFGLKGLGATQRSAGQAADAVLSWRRAVAMDERTPPSFGETLYYLAGCHAMLGGIAGTVGSGLSAIEGAAELDKAMGALRRAVAGDYRNAFWIKRDPDLDSLRNRDDFRLLTMDLAMPTEPFAQ